MSIQFTRLQNANQKIGQMIDGGVPKLIEHRKSYWKTAVSTTALSLVGFAAIVWLVFERQTAQRPRPALVILAWWAAGLLLLCGEMVTVLILSGALISLHRDSLEARGLPYVGRPREWHGGFIVRGIRAFLRGLRSLRGLRPGQLDLHAGDLVEILSREEILATLDSRGERDSLPFMPEMEAWCGRTGSRIPACR